MPCSCLSARHLTAATLLLLVPAAFSQRPADIASAPCSRAPRIDGRLDPGDWDAAARHLFTVHMTRLGGAAPDRQAECHALLPADLKTLGPALGATPDEMRTALTRAL